MEQGNHLKNLRNKNRAEMIATFSCDIILIKHDQILQFIKNKIDNDSWTYGNDEEKSREDYIFSKITYSNSSDVTFVCEDICTNENNERFIYLYDTRGMDETGCLIICLKNKEEAFINFTETNEDFHRQGLGIRRLLTAQEYCKNNFHVPLQSSGQIHEDAVTMWRSLYEKGLVEKIPGTDTYKFAK